MEGADARKWAHNSRDFQDLDWGHAHHQVEHLGEVELILPAFFVVDLSSHP